MGIAGASEIIPGVFWDKGGAVFNVKHPDFGAKGDGVTDDAPAFDAADAAAVAAGGGAVYAPPGTYRLSYAYSPSSGIRLMGAGRTTVLQPDIAGAPAGSSHAIWVKSGTTHVEIANLRIIGRTDVGSRGVGIFLDNCSYVTVTQVTGSGAKYGVFLSGACAKCRVHLVYWSSALDRCFQLTGPGADFNQVSNCIAEAPANHGFALYDADDNVLTGCTVLNARNTGLAISALCTNNVVTGFVISGSPWGAIIENAANDNVLFGAQVLGTTTTGVQISQGTGTAPLRNRCIGVVVAPTTGRGFDITQADYTALAGCTVLAATDAAFRVSSCADVRFTDCVAIGGTSNHFVLSSAIRPLLDRCSSVSAGLAGLALVTTVDGVIEGFTARDGSTRADNVSDGVNLARASTRNSFNNICVVNTGGTGFRYALSVDQANCSGNHIGTVTAMGMRTGTWRDVAAGQITDNFAARSGLVVVAYGASIATDASLGGVFKIVVGDTNAFTIVSPTNARVGASITYDIVNDNGARMGAITWGSAFRLSGAFVNPGAKQQRHITFYFDGTFWRETGRTAADQAEA